MKNFNVLTKSEMKIVVGGLASACQKFNGNYPDPTTCLNCSLPSDFYSSPKEEQTIMASIILDSCERMFIKEQ